MCCKQTCAYLGLVTYSACNCVWIVRFHAYTITTQLDVYERASGRHDGSQSTLVSRKRVFGGTPDGAGMRQDVMLIFEELEEARNNVTQIRSIIKEQNERLANGMHNSVWVVYSGRLVGPRNHLLRR